MSRIYMSCPPAGTKVGIAFSGGLDTRAAVLWMSQKGIQVYAYTADLGQPDEENIEVISDIAMEHGSTESFLLDCKEALASEGILAIQCGSFHIQSGGRKYFNTTPLGRAVAVGAILKAMKKNDIDIFGDGSTYKGNDIQRFYRYGILANPDLRFYKPWLDEEFVSTMGGRREMSLYLKKSGKPYHTSSKKAYSTDANLLGASHEGKALEDIHECIYKVDPIMSCAHWKEEVKIEKETVTVEFQKGSPIKINDKSFKGCAELMAAANQIGGRHGLGFSDQIENRIIQAKSRGIYEAPGMTLIHICYDRLLNSIHSQAMLDQYYLQGRRLSCLLYEGSWYEPEALFLKDALCRWIGSYVTGKVSLELRRGDDYSILATECCNSTYHSESLSMEKTQSVFTPVERVGSLRMLDIQLADSRFLLEKHDFTE